MIGATHATMTKAVLAAIEWPGDCNLAARNAMFPDAARVIEVEKYGAFVLGHSLGSLTHFCQPVVDSYYVRPVIAGHYVGYCWASDKSVPRIDLSKVKVIAKPDEWGFPVQPQVDLIVLEPFAKLVEFLRKNGSSLEADQLTYTTSANMAEWIDVCFRKLGLRLSGQEKQQALSILVGWALHLAAQDSVVPHHAAGILLNGHSAFEGDVDELYKKMEGSGEIGELLKTLVAANNIPSGWEIGSDWLRTFTEERAKRAYVGPRRLCFYMTLYRPGWKKLVRRCVLQGLTASVQVAKVFKRAGW